MAEEALRVIFVEDLESDYILAVRELEDAGLLINPVRVETESALREVLMDCSADVIVSDYALPQFDGMTALRTAKELCPDLPFVVLTGSMNEETAVECMKAGASDYVIKEHIARLPFAVMDSIKHARLQKEQRFAREELKAKEALLRTYVDSAPHGIFISDEHGKYQEVNPAAEKTTGYSRQELLQMSIADLYPEHIRGVEKSHLDRLKNGGSYSGISPFVRKDGTRGIWSVDATALPDGLFMGITVDVTRREEMKAELESSRKLLQRTQKIASVGSWKLDVKSRKLHLSRMAQDITGLSSRDLTIDEAVQLILPEYTGLIEDSFRNLIENSGAFDIEYAVKRLSDGEIVDVRAVAEYDSETETVYGSVQNVSREKSLEMDLKNLFNLSPDLVCVASIQEKRFIRINPAFSRVLGYSEEELLSRPFTYFVHPEDVERTERAVTEQLQNGIKLPRFENRYICKDGTYRDLMWSSHPIPQRDVTYAVAKDITELRKQVIERLQFERKLLHTQKLESLGVMAGGIAHDFNNLLMAIIGNLDMASSKLNPGSESLQNIEQAVNAARRAVDLTRQVLAYSGRDQKFAEKVNLTDLVKENVHMLNVVIPKTVSLKLNLAERLPLITADPGQLQQIVMNLITNASEAIEEDTGVVAISTGIEDLSDNALQSNLITEGPEPGQFVILEVVDSGIGMDEETAQRVFDPFFSSKIHGRGLGMSAVLGIVKSHCGAIFLESEPGRGTTIRVAFPANPLEECKTVKEQPETDTSVERPRKQKKSILLADDEAAVRAVASAMVSRLGYGVLEAENGETALGLFRENRDDIACIVLDLSMPVMDGNTFMKNLREESYTVPVILTSGYSRNARIDEILKEDTNRFLQKPYSFSDLKQTMAELLNK